MTQLVRSRSAWIVLALAGALAIVLAIPISGETIGSLFLASLRIEQPKTVTAAPAASAAGSRQLLNVVSGILAETTTVALEESDLPVPSGDSAGQMAGFRVRLVHSRPESPTFEVLGGRRVTVRVNRGQLQTLLVEAGMSTSIPSGIDGSTVVLGRPRGMRLAYGRCPAPVANTIQSQIQGPPPPSADNGNCVILTEIPVASVTVPAGLDTGSVMEIALELNGMSPNQARDYRSLFDWHAALALSAPRAMRSYEVTNVAGVRAILMIGSGRREPAYTLAWVRDGVVYTLTGYGSSADALPLAASVGE